MPHYDITIIGNKKECASLVRVLKSNCRVLLLHTFRNTIKNDDSYTVVFNQEKKCVQISTGLLIRI